MTTRTNGARSGAECRRAGVARFGEDLGGLLLPANYYKVGATSAEDTLDKVRRIVRLLEAQGYAVGAGGAVVETWRARARKGWIPAPWFTLLGGGGTWVRVIGGRLLEVVDERDGREESWSAWVDSRAVGEARIRKAAERLAEAAGR